METQTSSRRSVVGRVLSLTLCTTLFACDGLVDVAPDPQVVDGSAVIGLREALVGARAEFVQSFDSFVVWSGLFNDEFVSSGTAPGIQDWDRRDVEPDHGGGAARTNAIGGGNYVLLQRAVAVADIGQQRVVEGEFEEIAGEGTNSDEYARFSVITGFAKTFIGDLWCSTAFGGVGPELSSADAYARAEDEFTEAINATGASEETRQTALVGRARVRLLLGDAQGAVSDAQQVDPDFEAFLRYSTNSFEQRNRIHFRTWDFGNWSVGPAFRELTLEDGSPDPRVELALNPVPAFEPSQDLLAPLKVPTPSTALRYASGDEARFIIAEVTGGQTAVDIINEVRARHGIELEWEPEGTSPDEVRDKVLDERKRTLFLEGVRQGDLRRFIDQYGIDLFPTSTPQGFEMGSQTCLPLPEIERNNNPGL